MCQCGCSSSITFQVEGMSCGHCKAAVTKALTLIPGVRTVDVNLETKEVNVTYNAQAVSVHAMKQAITDAGYTVL